MDTEEIEKEIKQRIISIMLDTHVEFLPKDYPPTHEDSELYSIMAFRIIKDMYAAATPEKGDEGFHWTDAQRKFTLDEALEIANEFYRRGLVGEAGNGNEYFKETFSIDLRERK